MRKGAARIVRFAPETGAGARRRRPAAIALALVTALAVALPAGCGAGREQSRVVRVGYLRNDVHQVAYHAAREKGYFADRGLDVREGGAFNAGPEEMSAFSAGELDMGYVGASPFLTFAGQEMVDVRIVAQANVGGSAIVVRNGLEVEDVAGLKGRTIAVPGYSTVQDFLLRIAMKKAGLGERDVNVIVVKPPEVPGALAAGQVDAAVVWEPYPSMVLAQNAGRILETSEEIWPGHPCCMLIVDSGFLARNPDTVRRVVDAHVEATRYVADNLVEAGDMAHLFTGQPTEVARAAVKKMKFSWKPDVKGVTRYAEFLKSNGVIKVEDPASFVGRLVDPRFLPGDDGER